MRLLLQIIVLSILTLFFAVSINASTLSFEKDARNPLTHSFFALQTTGFYDQGKYNLWYTSSNGINLKLGFATSVDGVQWSSGSIIPLSDPGDNHDPSYFHDTTGSFLYYISEPAEGSGSNIQIHRTKLLDQSYGEVELIMLPRQPWNAQKLSCPYVYFENDVYSMFYCGTSGSGWQLGMATSSDGVNFTPCTNNPVVTGSNLGNTQLFVDNDGVKHLLFHSDSGVEQVETTDTVSCSTQWSNRRTVIARNTVYDQNQIIAPTAMNTDTGWVLFYTARGLGTNFEWRLARANELINAKHAIVLVPGYFSSWNKEGLLHNNSDGSSWYIPSFVKEYDGFLQTLHTLGYEEGTDLFVFAYDWRKPLQHSTDDLENFLQQNIWSHDPDRKVDLVGHSFGGVLSRVYSQKFPSERIGKIVTVGAPHRGVIQTYSPLEAGEVLRDNSLFWFGTKLMIYLNRLDYRTDRDLVRSLIPSLFDLFPTYEFLRTSHGNMKPVASLSIQNTFLPSYNSDTSTVQDKLTVIYGDKDSKSSPNLYQVSDKRGVNKVLGIYADGEPIRTSYTNGDYLVPLQSAQLGSQELSLPLDHTELIYTQSGIEAILNSLQIEHATLNIAEGSATSISPSIFVLAQSPVQMTLTSQNGSYSEEDGILVVPNAPQGSYTLSISKQNPGPYRITLAQISRNNDTWEQFEGVIDQADVGETDIYSIEFNSTKSTQQITKMKCKKMHRGKSRSPNTRECKKFARLEWESTE